MSPTLHYFYENQCLTQCPKFYLPNADNVCEKSDEPTYPFLSFAASGLVLLLVLLSQCIFPPTRLFTAYLALQSLVMVPLWVYLLLFLLKDQHYSSVALVGIGLAANCLLNLSWYSYYSHKIAAHD